MIPPFKPSIGVAELRALLTPPPRAVERFEQAFAEHFQSREAIAFSYGRTALCGLLQALEIEGAEVVMPAYTCSVVAHAVTLSRNTCRFVDVTLSDYNMDLGLLEPALSARTRMIVATHLFGYPLDVVRLRAVVAAAERRYGHKIWIVQDCAHAFGATWSGRLVAAESDGALFGLNISKTMTSIFGGMFTTSDPLLAGRLRAWRDAHTRRPRGVKSAARRAYLLAASMALGNAAYGAVRWLEDETPLLDRLTKAYHRDDQIRFPPDHRDAMLDVEAGVGLVQLARLDTFEQRRRENARFYITQVDAPAGWHMPPWVDGATYSHFPIRVENRAEAIAYLRRAGVRGGEVIQYSLPHMRGYAETSSPSRYPNSALCAATMINLPVHPGLSVAERQRIADAVSFTVNATAARTASDASRPLV